MASTQIVGFDNMERMSLNNCSLQPRLGSRFVNKDMLSTGVHTRSWGCKPHLSFMWWIKWNSKSFVLCMLSFIHSLDRSYGISLGDNPGWSITTLFFPWRPTIDTRLLELAFQSTSYGVKESWFVLFVRFIDETIYNWVTSMNKSPTISSDIIHRWIERPCIPIDSNYNIKSYM